MAERRFITLSDGTRLAVTLYRPATDEPAPCILEALPYRKDDLTATYEPEYLRLRDEHGYAVARLDLRGTGSSDGLATDESRLTGEPVAAAKGPNPVAADAPLAERSSVLYAGSAVVSGAGEGLVVAVGPDTEIGRLGRLVAEAREPPTPLQRAMAELARAALIVAVTACVVVPLVGVLRGQPAREMLLDGLTLAFATIPEELPILVTVLVAIGGLRLAQQGVLLRRLRAAEAVGAMTVLLADKTGTLTENRLLIERIDGDREHVLTVAAAAHGTAAAQDPVDRALVKAAGERASSERPTRNPFDPVRRRESAVWC